MVDNIPSPFLTSHSNNLHVLAINTTLCDKVCQCLAAGRWFSPGTPVLSTNETDRYDITEILLKVTLNTITLIETLNLLTERHFI